METFDRDIGDKTGLVRAATWFMTPVLDRRFMVSV